jgi:hypothetical protein
VCLSVVGSVLWVVIYVCVIMLVCLCVVCMCILCTHQILLCIYMYVYIIFCVCVYGALDGWEVGGWVGLWVGGFWAVGVWFICCRSCSGVLFDSRG